MAVKIKLKRLGKVHAPQYRIVVADARTARGGRAIEELGIYQPMSDPSIIKVDSDRVQYWLGVGAQPTEAVTAILRVTGDWQRFKGLPGAEGTLQVPQPKPSKMLAYEAAVADAAKEPKVERKARAPKAEAEAAVEAAAVEAAVETAVVEAAVETAIAEDVAEEIVELAEAEAIAEAEVVAEAEAIVEAEERSS